VLPERGCAESQPQQPAQFNAPQVTRQVCWLATSLRLVFDTAALRRDASIQVWYEAEEFCLTPAAKMGKQIFWTIYGTARKFKINSAEELSWQGTDVLMRERPEK